MSSIIVTCNKKLVECFIIHYLLSIKTCKHDKIIPVSPPPPPPPDHWTCRSWSVATRRSAPTAACISVLARRGSDQGCTLNVLARITKEINSNTDKVMGKARPYMLYSWLKKNVWPPLKIYCRSYLGHCWLVHFFSSGFLSVFSLLTSSVPCLCKSWRMKTWIWGRQVDCFCQ